MLEYLESNIVKVVMEVDGKMVYPKGAHQKDVFFKAKYTSSDNGKQASGWSNDGINKYNWYLGEVKRLWEKNGKSLDIYLRAYWLGETDGKEDKVGGKHMNIAEEAVTDMELFSDSVGM